MQETLTPLAGACRRVLGVDLARRVPPGPPSPAEERAVKNLLWHGLGPFASVVARAGGGGFSPAATRALGAARTRAVLTHRTALQVLEGLDPLLRRGEIPYAVLKGPHLQEALYRDLFPRPYGDIDLLVAPAHVSPAAAALETLGYRFKGGDLRRELLHRGHFHLTLENERASLPPVEVHWEPVDRANLYRIDAPRLLAATREQRAGGSSFGVLDPGTTLIYLALHAVKHGLFNAAALRAGRGAEWYGLRSTGNRLLWFVDLFLLIETCGAESDAPALAQTMRDWNVGEEVAEVLSLLSLLIPESRALELLGRLGLEAVGADARRPLVPRLVSGLASRPAHARLMEMDDTVLVRPARLFTLGALAFPSAPRLARYHQVRRRWLLPAYRLWHPLHMAFRLAGVSGDRPERRPGLPAPAPDPQAGGRPPARTAAGQPTTAATPALPGRGWYVAALLLVACIYWPFFDYPYIQDDWGWMRVFQQRSASESIARILNPVDTLFYRPLGGLYRLALCSVFGIESPGSHLGTVLLLAAAMLALARVVTRLTADALAGAAAGLAYGAMLSLHHETMLWLAGINDLGAALFVLLAADATLARRHRRAGALLFAALLFKEAAAFALLLLPLLSLPDPGRPRPSWRAWLAPLLPLLPSVALLALVRLVAKSPLSLPPSHPYVFDTAWQVPFQLAVNYLGWVVEALVPGIGAAGWFAALFRLLATRPGIVLAALLAFAGALTIVSRSRLLRPPVGGEHFPAAPWVLAAWAVLGLAPVLLLRNHAYRYYLVYSVAPLLGLLCWLLAAAGRRALGAPAARRLLLALVAVLCASAAIQSRRWDAAALTGIPLSGTNELLRRGRTVGIVREGLLRLHPQPPPDSVFVFDLDIWAFDRTSGLRAWYRRADLEVLAAAAVVPDGEGFAVRPGQAGRSASGTRTAGAQPLRRLDPARTFFFRLEGERLLEISGAQFAARGG